MPTGDESLKRLLAALDELGRTEAAGLLADAQAQARERVSSILTESLTNSLLEHVREQLPVRPLTRAAGAPGQSRIQPVGAPDESRSQPAGNPTPEAELAWYVFGVVSAEQPPALDGIRGIESDHPVSVVTEGSLAAIASRVTLEEFGETTLREHLADMTWIEGTARAHDAVLDAVRKVTTVIPVRLCTVYRSEDALRELLRRESTALLEALSRLAEKTEWGVKVFARPPRRRSTGGGARSAEPEDVSGSAYMQRLRHELEREEHEAHLVDQASRQIHERLCGLASEGVMLAVQRPEVAAHPGQMILNGAYLVRDEDQGAFHEEVQQMRSRFASLGLELSASGPWPAYNFLPGVIGVTW